MRTNSPIKNQQGDARLDMKLEIVLQHLVLNYLKKVNWNDCEKVEARADEMPCRSRRRTEFRGTDVKHGCTSFWGRKSDLMMKTKSLSAHSYGVKSKDGGSSGECLACFREKALNHNDGFR